MAASRHSSADTFLNFEAVTRDAFQPLAELVSFDREQAKILALLGVLRTPLADIGRWPLPPYDSIEAT
jgi:hypothetical protein